MVRYIQCLSVPSVWGATVYWTLLGPPWQVDSSFWETFAYMYRTIRAWTGFGHPIYHLENVGLNTTSADPSTLDNFATSRCHLGRVSCGCQILRPIEVVGCDWHKTRAKRDIRWIGNTLVREFEGRDNCFIRDKVHDFLRSTLFAEKRFV